MNNAKGNDLSCLLKGGLCLRITRLHIKITRCFSNDQKVPKS